jgi:hypothetical protein
MAANPLESRILPAAAGWSWRCGTALNLPNAIFFARMSPMDPGDQMPSQKHLVDARVDTSASENQQATA